MVLQEYAKGKAHQQTFWLPNIPKGYPLLGGENMTAIAVKMTDCEVDIRFDPRSWPQVDRARGESGGAAGC